MDRYFISYSSVDGEEFTLKLDNELSAGSPPIPVWVYKRQMRPGKDWDEQIVPAIRGCKGLLFVMTEDSVKPNSVCKEEWVLALKYKKPVIPLRLHGAADLPFRLGSRQYVDFFTDPFEVALARLRRHLTWMDTPESTIQSLVDRLKDLEREFPRAESQQQARIQEEIRELEQQIALQRRMIADPEGARRLTDERIASSLERERQPERPVDGESQSKFINPPPTVAPSWFQDRHVETALIGEFLKDDSLRLMTVVGRAGIGKTTMVCRLLKSLETGRLPDDGSPANVDGIVYLSATGSRRINLPHLYADLCKLLPENSAYLLDAIYSNSQNNTEAKMQALLEAFATKRVVALLDNFEDIVDTKTGEIQDVELNEALRSLLQMPQHGVKVILTTRVAPRALQLLQPGRQTKIDLEKGLESPYAEQILRAMDRDGKVGLRDASDELLAVARERTRGYPRALEALFAILAADRDTSLQEILNDTRGLLPENVVQVLVGEAFSRLYPLAQQVMQAMAVYAYPVPPTAVDYLLQPYQPGIDSAPVLNRLVNMQFARREVGNYYLHHVDRVYALGRVPDGHPEDWRVTEDPPYSRPSLQHRGAEYFRKVRRDESTWKSLEDLKPLIAEFDLLSASGDYEKAMEALDEMLPFLERRGHYRQVERLADRLVREANEPVRSIASGLAGLALSAMGDAPQAIKYLKAALETPSSEMEQAQMISWRLELARCYAGEGKHNAAANEYRRVLEDAKDDVEKQVSALVGLGFTAEMYGSYEEAGESYRQALETYVPKLVMQYTEEGEGGVFVPGAGILPPDVPVQNPLAWHPISHVQPATEHETSEVLYLFGIELATVEADVRAPEEASAGGEEAETSVELLPVLVTSDLASIWMRFAGLYARTDYLFEAEVCCRLALDMYRALEIDMGIARALNLLRELVVQVSDTEAEAIMAAQEKELTRARASGHRSLEVAILNDLAECYLDRSKVDKAEALYFELSRYADELEDPSLLKHADLGLARIEWARGNPSVAVAKLEKLLGGNLQDLPFQTDVQMMLGRVELARGRRDYATRYIQAASRGYAALGTPFQQVEAERLLASIAQDGREYHEAVRRFESALQIVRSVGIPSLITSVLCDLADAYLWAGARKQAVAMADEAYRAASGIELPLTTAEALMTIGRIKSELREFEPAETAFQKAKSAYQSIGNVYGQISALRGLAWLYNLAEQRDSQISAARQAWEMASNLGDLAEMRLAREELATTLSDCGFHDEAVHHMEVVVAEDPYNARAIINLGHVLYQAGEYDRSLEESSRALMLDPAQTIAIRNLGHAYLAKGLPGDAEREYRRAIQDRKGGENFIETIKVIKRFLSLNPDAPKGREMLQLFEEEQRRLEVEEKSAVATGSMEER